PLSPRFSIEELAERRRKKSGVIRRKNVEETEYTRKIYLPFLDLQSRLIRMEGRVRKLSVDHSVPTVMMGLFSQSVFLKPFSKVMKILFSSEYRSWASKIIETTEGTIDAPLVTSQNVPQDVIDWIKENFRNKSSSLATEVKLAKSAADDHFKEADHYKKLVQDAEKEMRRYTHATDSIPYLEAQRLRNQHKKLSHRAQNAGERLIRESQSAYQQFQKNFLKEIRQRFGLRTIEEFLQADIVQTGIFFVPYWIAAYSTPLTSRVVVFNASGKIVRHLQEWMTADLEFRVLVESAF
ncbi:MAG: hypothetical protein ACFFBD_26260, partial [Candidatus Hodarchaeota archaeon]